MPIVLITGDRLIRPNEFIDELEGFTKDGKYLRQIFLPCKHREITKCNTCPSGKSLQVPSCTLKGIKKHLTCVGCTDRLIP